MPLCFGIEALMFRVKSQGTVLCRLSNSHTENGTHGPRDGVHMGFIEMAEGPDNPSLIYDSDLFAEHD